MTCVSILSVSFPKEFADVLLAITAAKKMLSRDAIVGISASTVEEAVRAVEEGADYLGIGTLFATPT